MAARWRRTSSFTTQSLCHYVVILKQHFHCAFQAVKKNKATIIRQFGEIIYYVILKLLQMRNVLLRVFYHVVICISTKLSTAAFPFARRKHLHLFVVVCHYRAKEHPQWGVSMEAPQRDSARVTGVRAWSNTSRCLSNEIISFVIFLAASFEIQQPKHGRFKVQSWILTPF